MGTEIGFFDLVLLAAAVLVFLVAVGFTFGYGFWKAFHLVNEREAEKND